MKTAYVELDLDQFEDEEDIFELLNDDDLFCITSSDARLQRHAKRAACGARVDGAVVANRSSARLPQQLRR